MMYLLASFVLSFFPQDVLDEIWDLIESVSERFPTYSCSITVLNHEKLSRGKWYSVKKAIRPFSILPPISDLNLKVYMLLFYAKKFLPCLNRPLLEGLLCQGRQTRST